MLFFKLSWLGLVGYGLVLMGVLITNEAGWMIPAGVVVLVIYIALYKTPNPFAPWMGGGDGRQPGQSGQAGQGAHGQRDGQNFQNNTNIQNQSGQKSAGAAVKRHTLGPLDAPPGPVRDIMKLCPGCMNYSETPGQFCRRCGWPANARNQSHELKIRSFLKGRYMVGRTLGQGGFGITYIGWDMPTGRRVAIKEYFPGSQVNRNGDSYTVDPHSTEGDRELFERGKEKFLKEAERLAKFRDIPGIVSVNDAFYENNTAYIVMEYVEGRTLKEYLHSLGRPMLMADALGLLGPVAASLEQVHREGIIHRDISPDNIMLTQSGEAKLLDFGAARGFSLEGERTNTINLKMGYAPNEQYYTHGRQGPWTDEYALAATIYRCITGRVPESALERVGGVELTPPGALGADISPERERVLLKAMSLQPEERYPTVMEFFNELIK